MDTRLDINAILDGSIPLSKLAEKVGDVPYIWDGTTSETIFNELKEAIENNKVIVNDINQHILPIAIVNQTIYLYLPKSFDLFTGIEGNDVVYSVTSENIVREVGGTYIKKTSDRYATNELQSNTYRDFGILSKDTTFGFYNFTSIMSISEFAGQFSFGDTVYTVTFPDKITWVTIPESYKPNTTYQFKILNNIGSIWEIGNGEVAYKSDIPTKVSELEDDLSIVTLNDSIPIVESLVGDELIPIKQDGENKAVRADELVKGGKEVFIITPDMFEQTATVGLGPYSTLTFTVDGLNKFKEAVEANKIIGINKAVFNFIENSARPFTAEVEPGNYVFSTYVGVMEYGYVLSFELLNTITADIDRYDVSIIYKDFSYMKNMSADGSFYLDTSMFVEPAAGETAPGLELMEDYEPALSRAITTNKIIKINYNVLGYLDMIATPYAADNTSVGYFILDNIISTSDTAFQATVIIPETNYHLTIYYNNGIFTADRVDMSDIYILNPDDYSTAEDFRLLEGAIDNSRIIQLIVENTAFIGTVASKSDSSIFITFGITFPDYYVMDNPAIQYGAYSFNSDGTINKAEPKSLAFETTGDGTKFLSNDGTYKAIDLATTTTSGLMSAEDKTKLDQITSSNTSIVTQAEYDALVAAGATTSGSIYYIRG